MSRVCNGWFTCSFYEEEEGSGSFSRVQDTDITVICGLHNTKVTYMINDYINFSYRMCPKNKSVDFSVISAEDLT